MIFIEYYQIRNNKKELIISCPIGDFPINLGKLPRTNIEIFYRDITPDHGYKKGFHEKRGRIW